MWSQAVHRCAASLVRFRRTDDVVHVLGSGSVCLPGPFDLFPRTHRIKSFVSIIERSGLEGTFQGHPVQPSCTEQGIFNQIRLLRALSNLTLNVSRDGASTASLGNLCQGFTTLSIKKVFFISSLNLPTFHLTALPFVLSQWALLRSLSPPSL